MGFDEVKDASESVNEGRSSAITFEYKLTGVTGSERKGYLFVQKLFVRSRWGNDVGRHADCYSYSRKMSL